MKKLLVSALLLLYITQFGFSEPIVSIEQVIAKDYPKMEVYVSVKESHEPITTLSNSNFSAMIDGKAIEKKIETQGFQYTEEGIAYAVLVSANGLMSGEIMAEQKRAIVNLMEKMKDQDSLSVYYFGNEFKSLFEFEKKSEDLITKLDEIVTLGSNPKLYDALVLAARTLGAAKEKRKVLIVMSDGRNIESNFDKDQVKKIIDEQNIPLYGCGIYMMGGRNLSNLHELTEHSGGGYMHARSPSLISQRVIQLNKQITLGYVLKFKISGTPGDDDFHTLTIVVNIEGEELQFSKNFFAAKKPFPIWIRIVGIVTGALIMIGIIILLLLFRRRSRFKLGITKNKCPVCKRRMKDDWDECIFCKYLPPKKKKKKKKKKMDE